MARRKKKDFENVQVIDIGHKGYAIGKAETGEIVLVDDAVPGDLINGFAFRKKKGIWMVQVEELVKKSPWRKEKDCPHFPVCGGCKWQDLTYEKQVEFKEKQVKDAVHRIAQIDSFDYLPIVAAPRPYAYRNKLEFSFSASQWLTEEQIKSGIEIPKIPALGFHPRNVFQKVIAIETCLLMEDTVNRIRNFISEKATEFGLQFYNNYAQEGDLRTLILRNNLAGEWMLVLTGTQPLDTGARRDLLQAAEDAFPEIVSIYYVENNKLNDSIYDCTPNLVAGTKYLTEHIGGLKFCIGPKSFFQTNIEQTEKLYHTLKTWANLKSDEIVYDLYSGIGSIGMYVADACAKVYCVEDVEEAVLDAIYNKEINGLEHVEHIQGKVEQLIQEAALNHLPKPDLVITDPPRAGMHKDVVEFILKLKPKRILYVSCEPTTMARDLKILEATYELKQVQAFDLFPQTSHVESLALLIERN